MKIKFNNKTIDIQSTLLAGTIKNESPLNENNKINGNGEIFINAMKSLDKRLNAPLPLDKTYVHVAINELIKLIDLISDNDFIIEYN